MPPRGALSPERGPHPPERYSRCIPEPTVHLKETCPDCQGSGIEDAEVQEEGGSRTTRPSRPCPTCGGDGELDRWIGITELRRLMDEANG